MATNTTPRGLLTVAEAAALIDYHPESVRRLIRNEAMPARKIGARYYIHRDALRSYRKDVAAVELAGVPAEPARS